jgi:hypothetical protein
VDSDSSKKPLSASRTTCNNLLNDVSSKGLLLTSVRVSQRDSPHSPPPSRATADKMVGGEGTPQVPRTSWRSGGMVVPGSPDDAATPVTTKPANKSTRKANKHACFANATAGVLRYTTRHQRMHGSHQSMHH